VIYTHKVDGLTQADAVLAAKFNTISVGQLQ
jgi:pterin-4a-carbinolamine dehydratase